MANTTRVTLTYSDYFGDKWSFTVFVSAAVVSPDDAIIQGLITALNACVRAVNLRVEISKAVAYAGTQSVLEPYNTVNDKALTIFYDANGDTHRYAIPGPLEDALEADHRTIDFGVGTDWETWRDWMLLHFTGRGGQALSTLSKGYRKTSRRLNKE